ncbi:MAG: CorA family divalent cation transporter [Bacteroidota bacterium]
MKVSYYQVKNSLIVQIDQEIKPREWFEKLTWVNIRADNRKEVADYFDKTSLYKDAYDCIEHPENHPFSNNFEKITLLNLPVSNKENIYKADYISVIFDNTLIITIIPQESDLFSRKTLSSYSEKEFPFFQNFLGYISMGTILTQNNVNMGLANIRIEQLNLLLTDTPDKLSSRELMSCEREISQLSDIIEDQYVGFGTLTSISSGKFGVEDVKHTNKIIKGFVPLDNAMQRMEKKTESLRLQYMLLQQEKSTRKINVLTIVQAVFVPLTFLAGIYGMNFINMPGLKLEYGYLYAWVIFIGLASALITYFYKKGWFK